MAIGMRQVRAVVLIAGAVLAVAVVSSAYLRPEAPAGNPGPAPLVVQRARTLPAEHLDLTGQGDGSYFVWYRGGGYGGHA